MWDAKFYTFLKLTNLAKRLLPAQTQVLAHFKGKK